MATPFGEGVRQVVAMRVRQDGGHVKVRVWAGQENSPGLCGELTMRPDEWLLFRAHLDADSVGKSQCQIKYEGDVRAWLTEVSRGGPGSGHRERDVWIGTNGRCGAECYCGHAVDGYDTTAEASAHLLVHIAEATGTPLEALLFGKREVSR